MTAPIKLLAVDDHEENLVALEALLHEPGLEILQARSGAEALEILLSCEVALALVDVQMPEIDGFELAELMRGSERTRHIPIIFVTAGARDPQRVFQGYESGAVDFLFKPIEPHALRSKVHVFLELYRQRRDLADALRLNEMFVGILGHDLRNPLGTLLNGAQVLELQSTAENHRRVLRRMIAAGQRMTRMIEQILDLTRARLAGGIGFAGSWKTVELAQLCQRAIEELRGAPEAPEIRFAAEGDGATRGDPDRLLQVLSNLVANALQHGEPASPVEVRVVEGPAEVAVSIRNQGVIPRDLLPTIFDPFRSRQDTPSKSGGLGLGLFISQQVALAHEGRIDVASSEESGETVFTVRLPRTRAATRDEDRPATRRTILVVDDDDGMREALRAVLEDAGYAAATARNGREALETLSHAPDRPDLVILDLVLPLVDGGRVYQAMKADPELARIPVIVSTASPERAPPGALVLPKPLHLPRLLDCCREALAQSRPEERAS